MLFAQVSHKKSSYSVIEVIMRISRDARVACMYRDCGRITVDDRTDRCHQISPAPVAGTRVNRAHFCTRVRPQFPQTPVAVACEPFPVSLPVGKAQEVRLSIAYSALSYGMLADLDCGAGQCGSDWNGGSDPRRLESCAFSGLAIDGIWVGLRI